MAKKHFSYHFDNRWRVLFLALGIRKNDGVSIHDNGDLIATFGRFKVHTTCDNVSRTLVTGPQGLAAAIGK